jgi:glycosyltransferase involved in cell wall biosynthesis
MLKRSLESLKANTNVPYELIVVDDGSRDECWDYLQDLLKKKEISTLITNGGQNLGVGAGINRGFQVASGRFLVKLDADLEYKPGWLSAGVRILDGFEDVACVGFYDYLKINTSDARFLRLDMLNDDAGIAGILVKDFVASAMMIRRKDYRTFGFRDGIWKGLDQSWDFQEDTRWKMTMVHHEKKLAITPADLIDHFGRLESTAVDYSGEKEKYTPVAERPLLFGEKEGS